MHSIRGNNDNAKSIVEFPLPAKAISEVYGFICEEIIRRQMRALSRIIDEADKFIDELTP